jgi:hypothetical protein
MTIITMIATTMTIMLTPGTPKSWWVSRSPVPANPTSLDHKLFELFPSLQELRVSVATDDGQRGTRQRRGQPVGIDF